MKKTYLSELMSSQYGNEEHAFPLKAPDSFVARINKQEPRDPLLLQILPQAQEDSAKKNSDGYSIDPLEETSCSPLPGLLHKYHGRALLLITNDCPINCRFCFRRHVRRQVENWPEVFAYLVKDKSISEVILSGGEPLLWSNKKLAWLLKKMSNITHIKRIRIHTRAPIVIPERVNDGLLKILGKQKLPITVVVHCNHPQEINHEVTSKLKQLHAQSYALLNQTVLLKGINDDAKILAELSEKLFATGVLPYYLHMLDKVKGAAHFYVTEKQAKTLMQKLQQSLPGYLVPKLVKDVAGEKAKMLL